MHLDNTQRMGSVSSVSEGMATLGVLIQRWGAAWALGTPRHCLRIGVRVLPITLAPDCPGLVSGWGSGHGLRGQRSEGLGGRWEQRECAGVVLGCLSEGHYCWIGARLLGCRRPETVVADATRWGTGHGLRPELR